MKEKEIIDGSKLISEFIAANQYKGEYDLFSTTTLMDVFSNISAEDADAKHYFTPNEMQFHKSWDWLMPVVEKIEDFHNGIEYQVVIYEDEVEIIKKGNTHWQTIINISADGSGKLQNTYKAVVEFIKWFNEHKKTGQ